MRKTIAVYWPLALVAALVAGAYLQPSGGVVARTGGASRAPLAAERWTAELARAASYGMIDDAAPAQAKPLRAVTSLPLSQAS